MASQIMNKVLETEKSCEQQVAEAKAAALSIAEQSEKQAEQITAKAKLNAKAAAKEALAAAQKQADLIAEENRKSSADEICAMQSLSNARRQSAVDAVVALLFEVS